MGVRKYDTDSFIEKAKEVHGDKYDYSQTEYINYSSKVKIICPIHGAFYISPNKHLHGQGCRKCGYNRNSLNQRSNNIEFIEKAKDIHGDRYDYSKVEYETNSKKVCIICHEHGEFWQTPNSHLAGRGCPKCAKALQSIRQRSNNEEFIEKAHIVHGLKYDYSKVEYTTNKVHVTITCPLHGDFEQSPTHHLCGEGCPKCKYETIAQKQLFSHGYIIEQFRKIHGDKYDYSNVKYCGVDTKVCIVCPEHGEFWQVPWTHIKGCGCPKCGSTLSKNEDEIVSYLETWLGKGKVVTRDRSILGNRQEIDIFIPDLKIGIEYNGLLWHSDKFNRIDRKYHLTKTEICESKGYRLIHIFEDEYVNNKTVVLSKLKQILKCNNDLPKINARQTKISVIDNKTAKDFLNKNHIQGFVNSTIYIGSYYQEQLIGVMCFKQETNNSNKWELTRLATDINYVCRGVAGKLFKFFVRLKRPAQIKSFADRRWSTHDDNNLYSQLGFVCDSFLPPDYKYYDSKSGKLERIHKFNCRKDRLHKISGLPLTMTEHEMAKAMMYYRIYDCGLIRYIWRKEN